MIKGYYDIIKCKIFIPEPKLQSKSIEIIENGDILVKNDNNYDGLKEVNIKTEVPQLDTSDATATPNDIVEGKTAYVDGAKITGTARRVTEIITPATTDQPITNGVHTNSYVKGVTSDIDSNIIPENIRDGVTILGIEGNFDGLVAQEKEVIPTTENQIITPDEGYTGLTKVTVTGVTSDVDNNIKPENIKSGINILGVDGTVEELNPQSKTVNPSTSTQTVTPDNNYNALNQVTVNPVDNTIDSNILSSNIKEGINILGVDGNVIELKGQTKTVTPTTSQQVITPDTNYNGLTSVTVEPVEDETTELNTQDTLLSSQETKIEQLGQALDNKIALDLVNATSDANATANDIVSGKTAYVNGTKVTGNYIPQPNLQSKSITITSNTTTTVAPDSGYDGLDEVEITTNVPQLDTSDATATAGDIKLNKTAYVDGVKVTGTYDTSSTPPKIVDGMILNNSRLIPSNLDISEVTSFSYMFSQSTFRNFPVLDTSHITTFSNTWEYCSYLTEIELDLSSCLYMDYMFRGCSSLTTTRFKNATSSIKSLYNTFLSCSKLSDETLNSIMQLCIGATSYTGTKTLRYIGLTQAQATTCQSLSNYQAFLDAGWTTGYES